MSSLSDYIIIIQGGDNMLEQKINVEIIMFMIIIVILAITLSFLNKNPRLSKFRFEFKIINTEAQYNRVKNSQTKEKAIEANPNDHSR